MLLFTLQQPQFRFHVNLGHSPKSVWELYFCLAFFPLQPENFGANLSFRDSVRTTSASSYGRKGLEEESAL